MDNKDKIEAFLEQEELNDCNPTALPITDAIVKAIAEGRGELYDAEEKQRFQAHVGQFRWLADTTHPTLSLAASVLSSFTSKPGKGCLEAPGMCSAGCKERRSSV